MAVDERGAEVAFSYRRFTQHLGRPGWVEHDANEIWDATCETLAELVGLLDDGAASDGSRAGGSAGGRPVAAVGITNQRETTLAWNLRTGEVAHRAIVWQDTRTARACAELTEAGHSPLVRARTGLVIDPYFSATKMRWLVDNASLPPSGELALGTIDSWLVYKLTGGPSGSGEGGAGRSGPGEGGLFVTDVTNASRTLLFDIGAGAWDEELCELFGVPVDALAQVRPSCGRVATTADVTALGPGVPISGVAGDQQAALVGQACFAPGSVKVTYGTGSFVLMALGDAQPSALAEDQPPALAEDQPSALAERQPAATQAPEGLLVTCAASTSPGTDVAGTLTYALEGSVFSTGSAIDWALATLGLADSAAALDALASSVDGSDGVVFVPAFEGLGSPYWDPGARATLTGMTRSTSPAHLARAVLESVALSVRDVTDAMVAVAGRPLAVLRADGGVANSDFVLATQADLCGVTVQRPVSTQATAMGSAMLAGLAEGVWSSEAELAATWHLDAEFVPRTPSRSGARGAAARPSDELHRRWLAAINATRQLAASPPHLTSAEGEG